MSSALRPVERHGVRLIGLCLVLFLVSCTGDTTGGTKASPSSSAAPQPGAAGEAAGAYEVEDDSQAAAQRDVDVAEEAFAASPSGRYRVEWNLGNQPAVITGEFDLGIPAGRQVVFASEDDYAETLVIGADSWGRPTIDGTTQPCWFHVSNSGDDAAASGFLPGVWPLVGPHAVGYLAGEGSEAVVVDLLLDEAVMIASPKLANLLRARIDAEATIPAVVTVVDGQYEELEYRMSDMLAALDGVDSEPLDSLRGAVETAGHAVPVHVDYSAFGVDVTVEPPAPERVIAAGDHDELLQQAERSPDAEVELCEAAR